VRLLPRLGLSIAALALVSADVPERETAPGVGVLCLGAMLYYTDIEARSCHAGKDPAFEERLTHYVSRFDAYLVRNLPEGEADLRRFKQDQGLTPEARPDICKADEMDSFYDGFRDTDQAKLDALVDQLLMRDGPPRFGDCL
jgi:hypothetical protein